MTDPRCHASSFSAQALGITHEPASLKAPAQWQWGTLPNLPGRVLVQSDH
jgi:hypothetical protein